MKSFFNSRYIITKAPKKLKAIPNAVDLAMDLLLPSQGIKHRGESAYYHLKPRTFANTKVTSKKIKDFTRRLLLAQILYDTSGMI